MGAARGLEVLPSGRPPGYRVERPYDLADVARARIVRVRERRERVIAIGEVDVARMLRIAFAGKPFGEFGELARARRSRDQAAGVAGQIGSHGALHG